MVSTDKHGEAWIPIADQEDRVHKYKHTYEHSYVRTYMHAMHSCVGFTAMVDSGRCVLEAQDPTHAVSYLYNFYEGFNRDALMAAGFYSPDGRLSVWRMTCHV